MKISLVCSKGHVSETVDNTESALVIDLEKKTYRLYCDRCGLWNDVKMCIEETCSVFCNPNKDSVATLT